MKHDFTRQQITWTRQVRLDLRLSDKAVRIADAIAFDYINSKTLDAWPSMLTICERVGSSERAVRRALDQLVERGHLAIKSGGGRRQSNRYSWIIAEENPSKSAGVLDDETLADAPGFQQQKPRQKRQPNSGTFGAKTTANLPEEPSEVTVLIEPEGGSALGRAPANTSGNSSIIDVGDHNDTEEGRALKPLEAALGAPASVPPVEPDEDDLSWMTEEIAPSDRVVFAVEDAHEEFNPRPRLTANLFAAQWVTAFVRMAGDGADFVDGAANALDAAIATGGTGMGADWWRGHTEALRDYARFVGDRDEAIKVGLASYTEQVRRRRASRREWREANV